MTNTSLTATEASAFTADAALIIDDLVDRVGPFTPAELRPNAWGGFDVRQATSGTGVVRVAKDDAEWVVMLLTHNGVMLGSQRLSGCFATVEQVAFLVAGLI